MVDDVQLIALRRARPDVFEDLLFCDVERTARKGGVPSFLEHHAAIRDVVAALAPKHISVVIANETADNVLLPPLPVRDPVASKLLFPDLSIPRTSTQPTSRFWSRS